MSIKREEDIAKEMTILISVRSGEECIYLYIYIHTYM